ncbi:unnamed protein product [Cuscuta campestris]|uniref:Uncharacterized protein n=1 Tax=Cuscuta campestris TaxID=132261 RepID=A0A484M071_9ASTE|nr:unnamed protein product [Cuscuta campestris]
MINSQLSNGTTSNGTAKNLLVDNQLTGVPKKIALRDVQNQNGSLITNHRDSSLLLSTKLDSEGTRVCGNKRLTPERPSSPVCHLSLANNGANDHIINARRRIELELGRGRTQNDLEKYVESIPAKRVCQPQKEVHPKANQLKENNVSNASITVPDNIISAGKSNNRLPRSAQADSAKLISDKSLSLDFMVADDQQRTARFARLQMLLKKCDESDYNDYIQMLLHLSPSELSRHAVDLEKRAIQLAIDEGKEINRGKTLNILGKSPPDPTLLQTAPLLQSKHEQ